MRIEKITVSVVGTTPMLIHNGRTANPLDPYTKQMKSLTSKRNKTEEDIEKILELQWEASLYWDDKMGLYMPSANLYAAFFKAAKKHKLGGKCSAISFPALIGYPIITHGHESLEQLKANKKNRFIATVVVQRSKTISCRPIFHEWALEFDLEYETSAIDIDEIKTILKMWAERVGLGVWCGGSPKPGSYGKFKLMSIKHTDSKSGQEKNIL